MQRQGEVKVRQDSAISDEDNVETVDRQNMADSGLSQGRAGQGRARAGQGMATSDNSKAVGGCQQHTAESGHGKGRAW